MKDEDSNHGHSCPISGHEELNSLHANRLETLGRLTVGVAHDLNSLLTVILTCCGALEEAISPQDGVRDNIREVEQTCHRAAALTRQLLAFGRPVESRMSNFDLNEVLLDVEGMLRRLLPGNIDLRVRLCPEPAPVTADRLQIQQVLLNLALNSRDAMPDGGCLCIELRPAAKAGGPNQGQDRPEPGFFFELTVKDTGTGIPQELQEKVFESFVTTKSAAGGSGLGLATVARIVKQHGGSIQVESEPGKGSTFTVRLPGAQPATAEKQPKQRAPRPASGGETVLVIENDGRLCEAVRRVLHKAGYRVLIAKDVDAASRIAKEHPAAIHLLLADSDLSAIRASEFISKLQASQPEMRIVYTSSTGRRTPEEKRGREPDVPTMLKPFSSAELLATVRKVLQNSASQRLALVVDQDPTWQDAARHPLQDRGYTVITAQNEREALDWLKKKKFDLCVVELRGQKPCGANVIAAIRKEYSPMSPVVATGYFDGKLLDAARASGADAVMRKPYSRDDFLLVLDTHVSPAARKENPAVGAPGG